MEWMVILSQTFEVCIIPLLSLATAYLVAFLKAKKNELIEKCENDTLDKYIEKLNNTISDCVIATNQTYVETLKKQGSFDAEAQKIAFQKTYESVLVILNEDAQIYLQDAIGDLTDYITTKIEAEVNKQK